MTNEDGKEWSCGTCTFLNKPLYLACEMCGQSRPSQRPSPPMRQPSFDPSVSLTSPDSVCGISSSVSGNGNGNSRGNQGRLRGGGDRAPRQVQRHRSGTMEITGTLIMTDDPADYPTQDGKKPGDAAVVNNLGNLAALAELTELEQDQFNEDLDVSSVSLQSRIREEDPTLDESLDHQQLLGPARYCDSHMRRSTRNYSGSGDREIDQRRERDRRERDLYSHSYPHPQQRIANNSRAQAPAPAAYPKAYNNSYGTLTTAHMGSSSSRIGLDDASIPDDASNMSGSRASRYSYSSNYHQQAAHSHLNTSRSSLGHHPHYSQTCQNGYRHANPTAFAHANPCAYAHANNVHSHGYGHGHIPARIGVGGQEIQWHKRRSDGLPVIVREPSCAKYSCSCSCSGPGCGSAAAESFVVDSCVNSHYGYDHGSSRNVMSSPVSPREMRRPSRNNHPRDMMASPRNLKTEQSTRSIRGGGVGASAATGGGDFIESVLPSITPPPVPTLDSPGDVDVMAIFQKDRASYERRASMSSDIGSQQQPSTVRGCKAARAAMLDNLTKSGALASRRSLAPGSSTFSMASSSRRLQPAVGASVSSLMPPSEVEFHDDTGKTEPGEQMLDNEALDSPNTRRERRKEKNKNVMRGGIRAVIASMRISAKN